MSLAPQSVKEESKNLLDQAERAAPASSSYETWRKRVFFFLERPSSNVALGFHITNLVFIVGSIIISILSTIEAYETNAVLMDLTLYYELALLVWFSIEYLLRLWSCSFLHKYRGIIGALKFMKTLYMLIDLFVIISTTVTAILHIKTSYFTILRITRFLQIFRILRLDRQRGDLRTMGHVVYKHRKELVTCYFVGFIILFGGTYIVYVVENLDPEEGTIDNMANGLYWAMITVTSVGYGDISPKTWAGKLITGVFALIGCAFFALPSGILGSGFALQVAKQKKQKRYIKVRNPAAIVIQTCWRNYAIRANKYQLQGTWHYFFPQLNTNNRPEYYDILPGIRGVIKSEAFGSFTFPSLNEKIVRNEEQRHKRLSRERKNGTTSSVSLKTDQGDDHTVEFKLSRKKSSSSFRKRSSGNENGKPLSTLLSKKYKAVIRFIVRVKFWGSVKSFKNIRYPFVNVQDIMEKNALSHTETLSHLKDIHDNLLEFRSEIEEMKNFMNELRMSITPNKVLPKWQLNNESFQGVHSIESIDKVTDVDQSNIEKELDISTESDRVSSSSKHDS